MGNAVLIHEYGLQLAVFRDCCGRYRHHRLASQLKRGASEDPRVQCCQRREIDLDDLSPRCGIDCGDDFGDTRL